MPKKYLLYIHNSKFEKEKHKSAVINGLLDDYYGTPRQPERSVALDLLDTSPEPEVVERVMEPVLKSSKICKHGFPPSYCKYAKPGKACR